MNGWILNCAKAIGLSHMESNIPCQDNVITIYKNGVSVVVLSDGCGSAHFADEGSLNLVNNMCERLCNNFDEYYQYNEIELKKMIVESILRDVNEYAELHFQEINKYFNTEKGRNNLNQIKHYEIMKLLPKEDQKRLIYATLYDATLLFVAIKKDKCLIGHCGDGFIIGYKNDIFEIVSEEPKIGERNETNYPSSVYYLSKAYKDEHYWDLFRIIKMDHNDFTGFTLMSDGAEKSLISFKNNVTTPAKNNNELLYEVVRNETPEDASRYLQELLEQTYRSRENAYGDLVEITDDDVSIAVMVYNTSSNNTNPVKETSDVNSLQTADIINNNKLDYKEDLKELMTKRGKDDLDIELYELCCKCIDFYLSECKNQPNLDKDFKAVMRNKFSLSWMKFVQIATYGCLLKIWKQKNPENNGTRGSLKDD